MKAPCPLLDDDACIVYHCRPVPCRVYYSRSKEDCVKAQTDTEHIIYVLGEPVVSVVAARLGFQFGLRDAKLSPVAVELVSALDAVFNTRDPWKEFIGGRLFGELAESQTDLDAVFEEERRRSFARSVVSGEPLEK